MAANLPLINSRLNVNEARRHDIEREMMSITERLPPNIDVLLTTLQVIQEKLRNVSTDYEKRLKALEADSVILKKKQNLAELEHRLIDRMDDVVKALKATLADKNELTRKWRILDNRLENTLDIIVMQLSMGEDELRGIVSVIAKNSKKLKHANLLLTHLKKQMKLVQKVN